MAAPFVSGRALIIARRGGSVKSKKRRAAAGKTRKNYTLYAVCPPHTFSRRKKVEKSRLFTKKSQSFTEKAIDNFRHMGV
jgi:hypothetical protein